jgi:cation transporter-like permease
MGYFEGEIERAAVVALFVPLIISSGGNSGSQATSLIIRSLALKEMSLRDWYRVFAKELGSGLALGCFLGLIGLLRILLWYKLGWNDYKGHPVAMGVTVWLSLMGVVMFGSLAGAMLPFILRRLGFDPATSSAPFVATLVDVTGLCIYFLVAMLMLRSTLLAPDHGPPKVREPRAHAELDGRIRQDIQQKSCFPLERLPVGCQGVVRLHGRSFADLAEPLVGSRKVMAPYDCVGVTGEENFVDHAV